MNKRLVSITPTTVDVVEELNPIVGSSKEMINDAVAIRESVIEKLCDIGRAELVDFKSKVLNNKEKYESMFGADGISQIMKLDAQYDGSCILFVSRVLSLFDTNGNITSLVKYCTSSDAMYIVGNRQKIFRKLEIGCEFLKGR